MTFWQVLRLVASIPTFLLGCALLVLSINIGGRRVAEIIRRHFKEMP